MARFFAAMKGSAASGGRISESVLPIRNAGLMPEGGAVRLFGDKITRPTPAGISPRAEIYLVVDDPEAFHLRAIDAGSREISPLQARDWGHEAAYSLDPDGYVIAFAREVTEAE